MSKVCISLDDVKGIFKVLIKEKVDSVFQTRTLAFLKEMHNRYGTSFELYCTYRQDNYSLSDMSDRYREEFQNNHTWLKFGFHCIEESDDYSNIDCNKFEPIFNDFLKDINRATGQQKCLSRLRLHGFKGSRDICRVLHRYGVTTLFASDDIRDNYYLNDEANKQLLENGKYYEKEESLEFISSCVRLENSPDIEEQILRKIEEKINLISVFTHEWQMDSEIVRKRMEKCCRIEQNMRELEFLL